MGLEEGFRLGVVGAGVMGAGIAQLGCLAGARTLLCDADPQALERARERITRDLERGAERGRWSEDDARRAAGRLEPVERPGALAGCELVIEAVPEDLAIKRAVLAEIGAGPVLATNTSSLSIDAIAAGAPDPARVVGMHFFNPPPLMRLVEVVPGSDSDEQTVGLAVRVARAMGREPIVVRDSIGFLVNRCGRPFYGEALRLVDEGVATPAEVDRACRLGAGFRMGPFELMDLVGVDVGFAVMRSFAERSFGEPRWLPSPSQARLVDAGRLGRKSGRGWYDYRDGARRPDDPPQPEPAGGAGRLLAVLGDGAEARALRALARERGFEVADAIDWRASPFLVIAFDATPGSPPVDGAPLLVDCSTRSLAAARLPRAAGFHVLPPAAEARALELTTLPTTAPEALDAARELARALGWHVIEVGDAPGLVLGRIVAQLVNEACFAVGEGVAEPADVDRGVRLGLNHPHGPLEWGARIGWAAALARLDGVWSERRDPRYRPAPLLRRAALSGLAPARDRAGLDTTGRKQYTL